MFSKLRRWLRKITFKKDLDECNTCYHKYNLFVCRYCTLIEKEEEMGVRVITIKSGDSGKELELSRAIAEGAIIQSDTTDNTTGVRIVKITEAVNFTD